MTSFRCLKGFERSFKKQHLEWLYCKVMGPFLKTTVLILHGHGLMAWEEISSESLVTMLHGTWLEWMENHSMCFETDDSKGAPRLVKMVRSEMHVRS